MTDLKIAWEPLDTLLDEGIEDLVRAEWEEVSVDRERMPLALDWDEYRKLEELHMFRCLGCRRDDKLIGFSSFVLLKGHMHYKMTPHALNDAIYVSPTERGITGIRLLLEAERQIRALYAPGIVRVLYYSKDDIVFGRRATDAGLDSLDAAAEVIALMDEFDVELPQMDPPTTGSLGDLLAYIGYKRFETAYGKFIGG